MNKITKLILRLIKETKKYSYYVHNENFFKQINCIAIPWVRYYRTLKLQELYELLDTKINIKQYRDFCNYKNIIIYDIKNVDKLFKYLFDNGIVWGSNKTCTMDNMPKEFKPSKEDTYIKLYNDDNRIYYGTGFNAFYTYSEITLTEEEFYEYYEKYKKRINDNFERFLKKKNIL